MTASKYYPDEDEPLRVILEICAVRCAQYVAGEEASIIFGDILYVVGTIERVLPSAPGAHAFEGKFFLGGMECGGVVEIFAAPNDRGWIGVASFEFATF